ncbi:Uncharacterised protein [Brevibacterium casei]|uniref:Uncharacterized protein n=2 Tax=Brevibacterium casei TaxID=33889 RepID=A0A449CZ64_9MICO|nr:Uncharacterised protein [Brevibacterium casei]
MTMTSPNFAYPQPTDDELAAQGPAVAPIDPPLHRPVQTDPFEAAVATGTPGSPRLGKAALILALAAAGISLIASAVLGVTAGPAEAANGSYFGDDSWYQTLGVTLFSVQAVCTIAGLTGLVLGIAATVTDRGRTPGIIATAVAAIAPIVSFALFLVLSFAFL